jgi:hypothetical protein
MKHVLFLFFLLTGSTAFGAGRDALNPVPAFTGGCNVANNCTSIPIHTLYYNHITVQYVWTGTPTGTLGIQTSNQTLNQQPVPGSFTPVTLTGVTEPAGSAGSFTLFVWAVAPEWLEVTYAASGGTGTLQAYVTAN